MKIGVQVPNISCCNGSATMTKFVVVDAESAKEAAILAEGIARESGWHQWNGNGESEFQTIISSYKQPDCIVRDGLCESKMFDRLVTASTDWTKLPDWPAWSALAACEPLGVY